MTSLSGGEIWTAQENCTVKMTSGGAFVQDTEGKEATLAKGEQKYFSIGDKLIALQEGCRFDTQPGEV
jgi:hypothetical protein